MKISCAASFRPCVLSSITITVPQYPRDSVHIDAQLAAGIHGIVMLGTVGENCSLEYSEKIELLKATVAHVRGPRARADRRRPSARRPWPAGSPRTPSEPASTG